MSENENTVHLNICATCGDTFTTTNESDVYCSPNCTGGSGGN